MLPAERRLAFDFFMARSYTARAKLFSSVSAAGNSITSWKMIHTSRPNAGEVPHNKDKSIWEPVLSKLDGTYKHVTETGMRHGHGTCNPRDPLGDRARSRCLQPRDVRATCNARKSRTWGIWPLTLSTGCRLQTEKRLFPAAFSIIIDYGINVQTR